MTSRPVAARRTKHGGRLRVGECALGAGGRLPLVSRVGARQEPDKNPTMTRQQPRQELDKNPIRTQQQPSNNPSVTRQ